MSVDQLFPPEFDPSLALQGYEQVALELQVSDSLTRLHHARRYGTSATYVLETVKSSSEITQAVALELQEHFDEVNFHRRHPELGYGFTAIADHNISVDEFRTTRSVINQLVKSAVEKPDRFARIVGKAHEIARYSKSSSPEFG